MTTLFSDILQPTNRLANMITPGKTGALGSVSDKGCPPAAQCKGCVPFCYFEGQEIKKFVTKTNLGKVGFDLVEAAISICVPGGAIAIGAFELLNKLTDYINFNLNKKSQEAYAKKKLEAQLAGLANVLQGYLQTRLPWCDVIKKIQQAPVFASNSSSLGSRGPEIGVEYIRAYAAAANALNNSRFGKTKQKIISLGAQSKDGVIKEAGIYAGQLSIKVPNVQHYWMDDEILLPGFSTPVKIVARYGKSKMYTHDCDRVILDERVFPFGNYAHGRGCHLTYNINTMSTNIYANDAGAYEGYNCRNMYGEGYLLLSCAYTSAHDAMVGKYIDLTNPIYIDPDGQVYVPATNNNTAGKNGTGNNSNTAEITDPVNTITPSTGLASFAQPLSAILLVGIGVTFIYKAIKNN